MTTTTAAPSLSTADRAAIERVFAHQAEAWNRHDMHGFAADMTPDADWINVVGMHWHGRDTIEHAHAALHHLPLFANSRMVPGALEVRPLSPDVALAVWQADIKDAGPTPGGGVYPTAGAIGTFVLVRTAAGWRIAHGHNTSIDAEAVANDPAKKPR